MVRVVKDDGFVFLIAPSSRPIDGYPLDCYRFYADLYAAPGKRNKTEKEAIFRKSGKLDKEDAALFSSKRSKMLLNSNSATCFPLASDFFLAIFTKPSHYLRQLISARTVFFQWNGVG
jgi:hypothetical protein